MEVIKKINNNVAICIDSDGNELVAFGKGIGFPKTPYELKDLSKIKMTFYQMDYYYYNLLKDLPSEIIELSVEIVDYAQKYLNKILNPNLIFILADHINFAIYKLNNYGFYNEIYSFEIEQAYPKEAKLAKIILNKINKEIDLKLPNSEITNLTMHFVNAGLEENCEETKKSEEDIIIGKIVDIISSFFNINIKENTYNYHRLILHLRSYLSRIDGNEQFSEDDDNSELTNMLKVQNPKIYNCAELISNFIYKEKNIKTSNDEILYLMIHLKRVI